MILPADDGLERQSLPSKQLNKYLFLLLQRQAQMKDLGSSQYLRHQPPTMPSSSLKAMIYGGRCRPYRQGQAKKTLLKKSWVSCFAYDLEASSVYFTFGDV